MSKKATFGPIECYARTTAQAKLEAESVAIAALNRMGSAPIFIIGPFGNSAMVYPSVFGWDTCWLEDDVPTSRSVCSSPSTCDRSLVILAAIQHLAERHLDGTTEILSNVIDWLNSDAGSFEINSVKHFHRAELDSDIRQKNAFVAAYQSMIQAGHSETESHRIALDWTGGK
jgi:hypothetical protein